MSTNFTACFPRNYLYHIEMPGWRFLMSYAPSKNKRNRYVSNAFINNAKV